MIDDLVSIITPSYNSEALIVDTIQSVLEQTYQNWELLIVDDFSKDSSVSIINRFVKKDSRIKLFALDKNVGAASARNVAISNARGQYIAFLDSDDVWMSNKLETHLSFMKQHNVGFTFSDYYVMTENGVKTGTIIKVPHTINYNQYLKNTIIGCLTVVIDRKIVGDFKMPIIKSSHDMALWLLILKRGFSAYGINRVLAGYRLVANSNSSKKWKAAKDVWKVYRDIEKLSFFYSGICFIGYTYNAIKKRL